MNLAITEAEPKLLDLALEFTQRHQSSTGMTKAKREVYLLRGLFPGTLLRPMKSDLIAGRVAHPLVGISNEAFPENDTSDTVGYYYDKHRVERIASSLRLEGTEMGRSVAAMTRYWTRECSYRAITDEMDGPMRMALPSRKFPSESAAAHRLYRIASHSVDYAPLIEMGIPAFRASLQKSLSPEVGAVSRDFLEAGIDYLDLFDAVMAEYAESVAVLAAAATDLRRRSELNRIASALGALRVGKPSSFFEAVQLIHLYLACGYHCNALGRLDDSLGPLLKADLEASRLTEEEAVRILVSCWRLWDEHFVNSRLTIGGEGRKNPQAADVFCRVALEATRQYFLVPGLREIRRPARQVVLCPQVAFRFSNQTPPDLMEQAYDVIGSGTTFPILYNDEVNIPAVARAFRVSREEAAQYTFFSCGEYLLHNASIGTPSAIVNLPKILELALHDGVDPNTGKRIGPKQSKGVRFENFEDVWDAYALQAEFTTHQCARFQKLVFDVLADQLSFVAMSLLLPSCRERGMGMLDGGCENLGGTFETYGNITAADSLYAIKRVVFEEGMISMDELTQMLDSDFAGTPQWRDSLLNLPKFGNNKEPVDAMAQRVNAHISLFTRSQAALVGLDHYLVVAINNGANVLLGRHVRATADGRNAGQPVSNGHTPSAGRDTSGLPALLQSILKLSPDYHAGAVHNLRFSRSSLKQHRAKVLALLATYFEGGGTQCMITVTSREELLDALEHPESYGHLLVRVGGYSARFIDLPEDIQMELVNRNAY